MSALPLTSADPRVVTPPMTHADIASALILAGLSAYLLFGGADFGAGIWHLLSRERIGDQRVIERAMGPLWEAHHLWLALVLLLSWTAFPALFADVVTAYRLPLGLAGLGLLARGGASVFAQVAPGRFRLESLLEALSLLTPYFLGAVAAAVVTGEPSWMSVSGVYGGALTTSLCAYLAAVRLIWDARRVGDQDVLLHFQGYAIVSGVTIGLFAIPGALALGVGSPLILVSALAGLASIVLVVRRRFRAVRVTGALAVVSVLWGAASMAHLDLSGTVAGNAVLDMVFAAIGAGALVLVPSAAWVLVQRGSAARA
ncbi:cytochrome d ubiquinol oxidase subunit II [Spirillospora sp. NPDC052269]